MEHGLGLLDSFQAALPASWSLVPGMPSYLSLVFTFENRDRLDGRLQQNTHLASCWASSGLLKEGMQSGGGLWVHVEPSAPGSASCEKRPGPLGGNPGLSDFTLQNGADYRIPVHKQLRI